ncbi:MAG TPA: hypothetical protein DEQ64_22460 [Lachnoclostridium sp.]|nr:hypothetical protein [Lachnoclostridium sp.]
MSRGNAIAKRLRKSRYHTAVPFICILILELIPITPFRFFSEFIINYNSKQNDQYHRKHDLQPPGKTFPQAGL